MKNTTAPKISVIVPVYKVEKYLDQCVSSIINQTYKNLEIILVDDGSPDSCPELCDRYAKQDGRVRVIHKANGGLSSARNAGLDTATGDVIAFVDSDDWIDCDAYEKMMDLKNATGAEIVCCDGVRTDGKKFYKKEFHNKPDGEVVDKAQVVKELLLDQIGSQVWKCLYNKVCWENIRFPVGRLYEDIPVTFRVVENAEKIAFTNVPFYKYRVNANGISRSVHPLKSYHIYLGFKEHYEYAEQHYPDIAPQCCAKAAQFAISTYFHYCSDGKNELRPYQDEVYRFLIENKSKIEMKQMEKSRRFALRLLYFSQKIFMLFCFFLYKTGLQTKLNLNVK